MVYCLITISGASLAKHFLFLSATFVVKVVYFNITVLVDYFVILVCLMQINHIWLIKLNKINKVNKVNQMKKL